MLPEGAQVFPIQQQSISPPTERIRISRRTELPPIRLNSPGCCLILSIRKIGGLYYLAGAVVNGLSAPHPASRLRVVV